MSQDENKNNKILQILIAVILILIIGTTGYYLIEDDWSLFDSFYMTVITITTVGFGETKELSLYGRIFTVIIIFIGIGIVALSAGQLASFIINREIKSILGREKIQKKLKKLKNHFIICGFNNISRGICSNLLKREIPFVVISEIEDDILECSENMLIVKGDASKDDFLIECGVKRANGVVVCKNSDADNIYISLAAKELNANLKIVAISSDPKVENRMVRAGVDFVVYPLKLGGEQIAREIMRHLGKKSRVSGGIEDAVYGYYMEYYCHFDDQSTTVKKIKDKMSAVTVLALVLEGDEVINNPIDESIVSKNDSLILVSDKNTEDKNTGSECGLFKWESFMSVGVLSLDKDHQHLVNLINKIENAVKNKESRRVINQVFDEMFEYVLIHFKHEEILFEELNYPGLELHKKIHNELLLKVKDLDSKRAFIRPESIISFLKSWIKHHIMEDDKKYSDYLISKGAK
jgi:voltage-gated potassium channel